MYPGLGAGLSQRWDSEWASANAKPHPPLWYGISNPDTTHWAALERASMVTLSPTRGARAAIERSVSYRELAEGFRQQVADQRPAAWTGQVLQAARNGGGREVGHGAGRRQRRARHGAPRPPV